MISISRSLARQFRAVARRAGLSARHAGYVRLVATARNCRANEREIEIMESLRMKMGKG